MIAHICQTFGRQLCLVTMRSLILWFAFVRCLQFVYAFVDISPQVFAENHGILAAFGDFDSDKLTDVFRVSGNRSIVEILIAQRDQPYFKTSVLKCDLGTKIITSVVPGDFNGDSQMDLMLTLENGSPRENDVVVLWGNDAKLSCAYTNVCLVTGQPLVVDYNADMIPDIFGEYNGKRFVRLGSKDKTFNKTVVFPHPEDKKASLRFPHSCAFVDLDSNGSADLFITSEDKMEYWLSKWSTNDSDRFTLWKNTSLPAGAIIGQSIFVDMDLDGQLEHVLPICYDEKCENSSILISEVKEQNWKVLLNDFKHNGTTWRFIHHSDQLLQSTFPITLRFADLDMDGYVDLLTVLESRINNKTVQRAFVLQNVPNGKSGEFSRTLSVNWNMDGLHRFDNVYMATFYDFYENGVMDVMLLVKTSTAEWKTVALENNFNSDAYFIKVLVLSGYSNCREKEVAYGTNQPGSSICYETTRTSGQGQGSCSAQLSQSAHFALQLPYSVFGLGQTPNFVDHLDVVIPGYISESKRRQRSWTQIIPNSQIVIIPCPANNPVKWKTKLFVTPSNLVIMTLAALIGTCIFILIIIGILHWKERREDRREKLQEAHRFHFDAM